MATFRGFSAYRSAGADDPSGPEPLGWRGYRSCLFCGRSDTDWQHDLDRTLVEFRARFERGHIWASTQVLCDGCEQRYRRGEYLALARLRAHVNPDPAAGDRSGIDDAARDELERSLLIQDELIALAAFCRADLSVRKLVAPDFPDGFEPVDEHTGAEWVTEVWPAEFRRSVAETRSGHVEHDPGARIWLLRSPWPSLGLAECFTVLWTWAERDRGAEPGSVERSPDEGSPERVRDRVVEALGWTDAQAVEWLAARDDPTPI